VRFDCSSHIPDEKGVGDKKFKSDHQTFSAGGRGRLGMRLAWDLAMSQAGNGGLGSY